MRHNIAIRTVGMVSSRTSYVVRHALCLMRKVQCGIGRTQHIPSCCDSKEERCHLRTAGGGFTIIELLIVVVIIAIAALVAIPMMTSADSFQIRSAANMIAADLEYAKTIAISRGQRFSVVFDKTTESYRIEDESGAVIAHPVKKGFDYIIDFQNDSRLNKVDIEDVNFDTTSEVTFDYLGSPYDGDDNPLNSGVISLRAGQMTVTVNIEPVTGFISIVD
jgi:prepilin-type N-terminal cleavage/methylation domain-containing protein